MEELRGNTELGAILELQKMIADELDLNEEQKTFTKSFVPLTDGLGLDSPSPKRKEHHPLPPPPPPKEVFEKRHELREEVKEEPTIAPPPRPTPSLASVIEPQPERMADEEDTMATPRAVPPPLPRPSLWRRAFATFVDEVFVLTLFAVACLITLNALDGSSSYFSLKVLAKAQSHAHPLFVRFALLEFAALWLCYFAVCLGLVDTTFGMWVWGIRVAYNDDSVGLRKLVRIILSFFFFSTIIPLFFLAIRRHGRNLMDWLSGSHLYRSMV